MKISSVIIFLFGMTCFVVAAQDPKPNIVFVLADDLGWSELGCYGNQFNETPHLDDLAKEGLRFTDAYAAAPVCSPYRAAFLTGQHPARLGIIDYLRPNSANGLSTELTTLPEALEKGGYATGMVGKWHLTGYQYHGAEFELRPADHGFKWNVGSETKGVGNGANTWPYIFRDQPVSWIDLKENRLGEGEYLTDRLNLEAVGFIERSAKNGKPFFLYLSHFAPHSILNGRKDLVEKYVKKHPPGESGRERCYLCEDAGLGVGDPGHHWAEDHNPHLAAMLESIDDGIGKITEKLEKLGLAENTILIFTSDNGGESNVTSNAPLRGGKSELYEGGIRVPLIVRWPSRIAAGKVTGAMTQNTDFYPTLLEAAGIEMDLNQVCDGVSSLASWKDRDAEPVRSEAFWHYPLDKPHFLGGVSAGAVRSGNWKLIEKFDTGKEELYSLSDGPGELKEVSAENPAIVAQLKTKLSDWRRGVGAIIPSPPLLTTTRQLFFADHFTPGMVSERLWYGSDWVAEGGVLKRFENGTEDTRIFLRDAEYGDSVIRFNFRLGESRDIRLVSGSGGGYNTVVHIRPDHFYIQTAKDSSVPYFSYRHGECAFKFDPEQWYAMTVEFTGDEAIAHLDHEHIARAQHPIINRKREYLAFQVDDHAAMFDNFQVFTATSKKGADLAAGRSVIDSHEGKFPVEKSHEEALQIQKTNAHEWFYQRDPEYKQLVGRVDNLDARNKELFPAFHQSTKDYRKKIDKERRQLQENDPVYKESLAATHRANRAIDDFLISRKPELADLPNSRKKAEIERLRNQHSQDKTYLKLFSEAAEAQTKLEKAYPQLFVTDEAINAKKKVEMQKAKSDPAFKQAQSERAAAYRAQQDYLARNDKKLAELLEQKGND